MRALDHRELEERASALAKRHSEASVYCVDNVGATFLDVPTEVSRHFSWSVTARSPIELMAPDFQSDGTNLFVECRRSGSATGMVRFADAPNTDAQLHLLNRGDCVIGIVVPGESAPETTPDNTMPDTETGSDNNDLGSNDLGSNDLDEGDVASAELSVPQETMPDSPAAASLSDRALQANAGAAAPGAAFVAAVDAPSTAPEPVAALPLTSRMILHLDAAGVIRDADTGAAAGLGRSRDELIGQHLLDLMHPDDVPWAQRSWTEMVGAVGGRRSFQGRYRRGDGSVVVVDQADTNALDGPHNVVVCEMIDVTEAVTAKTRSQFQESLLAHVSERPTDGVLFADANGAVEYRNARWGEVTGLADTSTLADFVATTRYPDQVDTALTRTLRFGEQSQQPVRFNASEGELAISPMLGPTGERGALFSISDVRPAQAEIPIGLRQPEQSAWEPVRQGDDLPAASEVALEHVEVPAPAPPDVEIEPSVDPTGQDDNGFPAAAGFGLAAAAGAGVAAVPGLVRPSTPEIPDLPDPPSANVPDADLPNVPDLPAAQAPQLAAPVVELPAVEAPAVQLPPVEAPPLGAPAVEAAPALAAPSQRIAGADEGVEGSKSWSDFWSDEPGASPAKTVTVSPRVDEDVDYKNERAFGTETGTSGPVTEADSRTGSRSLVAGGLGVLLVAAVAAVFRFLRLDSVPGRGLSQLEAVTAVEADTVRESGSLYSTVGFGQPAGPLHIRSWISDLLPDGAFGARLTSAVVGVLTCVLLWAVVRRRFGDLAATVAGLALGTAVWHLHYSRIDLGIIWWPLAFVLFLWAVSPLLQRHASGNWWRWIVAGVFLGLGSYVANANWIVMVAASAAILLWALFRAGTARRSSFFGWLAMSAISVLVALPMGLALLGDEEDAIGRFEGNDPRLRDDLDWNELSIFERIWEGLQWWATSWGRMTFDTVTDTRDALGAAAPMNLFLLVGAAVGLLWMLAKARSGFAWLLVVLTLALPLGAAFTADYSLEHALPLVVILALFAGVGLAWILNTVVAGFGRSGRWIAAALALAIAAVAGFITYSDYFDVFANSPQAEQTYTATAQDGIKAAADLDDDVFVNFYSARRGFNGPIRQLNAPDLEGVDRSSEFSENGQFTIRADDRRPQAWLLYDDYLNVDTINRLEDLYPEGRVTDGGLDDDFLVFVLE